MVLLETKNIDISFSGLQILFNVDFTMNEGEIHCLCGENGAGKSTLVKVLTGINSHYKGSIFVRGQEVKITGPRVARQLGIYAVQQHRDLVPTMNSYENIFLGNEYYLGKKGKQRLDFTKMRLEALQLVAKFGVSFDIEKPVSKLKVSEQGVVAICKALVANSQVLLIDEASAPLDDAERQVLYSILQKLRDEGKGILYITHHLEEVFRIGDRITVLRNGSRVATTRVGEFDRSSLIHAMTGDVKVYEERKVVETDRANEAPVIEFDQVTNDHLSGVSFKAYKGEIVGFAGLEGSFKDEVALIAFGQKRFEKGTVRFKGDPLVSRHPIQSIRKGIGLVPTDRKNAGLVTCRSVSDNVIMTAINKFNMSITKPKWIRETVEGSIRKLGIRTSGPQQLVEYLSGGNQQKVLVGKWLEADVDILFLVEPTEGIDVGARADLYEIFKKMVDDGKTLVVFTSDIDELMTLCSRIYTMVEGWIVNSYRVDNADKRQILSDILSKRKANDGGEGHE